MSVSFMLLTSLLLIPSAVLSHDVETLKKEADALAEKEQFFEAIKLYKECHELNPQNIQCIFNAALCLLKIGHIDETIALFESLVPRVQDATVIRYNIAYAHKTAGRLDTAIKLYQDILRGQPGHESTELALGFAYIQNGDFVHGWEQHSKYLKRAGKNGDRLRMLLKNNSIAGRRIVLHYEGGLGDTLMFVRYAERLKKLGAITICMVQEPLIPLLSRCPYIDEVISFSKTMHEYDAYAPLMSMPAIFEDTEITFPVQVPYLYPDEALMQLWHERLAPLAGIKIGLCWQADVFNDSSRLPIARRGIPLNALEPLLCIPNITYISLQRYDGTEQIAALPADCTLITYPDLDTNHGCFMDTAALIKNLDCVIAIDSAVAHLAGALGIPTILLLPYNADWRWIINRTDSPWYPYHTIFKQPAPFDWYSVIEAVRTYLESVYLKKKDFS